jgi:hypothetical protein
MKFLVGFFVAIASGVPALAFAAVPAPAPDLGVGAPAVLAVIGAYAIARLLIRRRATRDAKLS